MKLVRLCMRGAVCVRGGEEDQRLPGCRNTSITVALYYLSSTLISTHWVYKHATAWDRGILRDRDMSTGAYVIDLCEDVCVSVSQLVALVFFFTIDWGMKHRMFTPVGPSWVYKYHDILFKSQAVGMWAGSSSPDGLDMNYKRKLQQQESRQINHTLLLLISCSSAERRFV